MEKEKEEKIEEERGWRRWMCVKEADRRTWGERTNKTGLTCLRDRELEGVEEHLVVEVVRSALVFANPATRTQAAGGGAVVGEVAAQVGVEGGVRPVRTRLQPS